MDRNERTSETYHQGTGRAPGFSLKAKRITGAVLVLVLSLVSGILLYRFALTHVSRQMQARELERVSNAMDAITDVFREENSEKSFFEEHLRTSADLKAEMLRPLIDEDGTYRGPAVFEDGIVVRVEGNEVLYPEGYSSADLPLPQDFPSLSDDLFHSEISVGDEKRPVLVLSRQLFEDTYYLEWTTEEDEQFFLDVNVDRTNNLNAIEAVNGSIFLIYDEEGNTLYDVLEVGEDEVLAAREAIEKSSDGIGTIHSYGQAYRCLQKSAEGVEVLFLLPQKNVYESLKLQAVIIGLLIFAILSIICVWLLSVQNAVSSRISDPSQLSRYSPKHIRRRTVAAGALCIILLFAVSLFVRIIGSLYQESRRSETTLDRYAESVMILKAGEDQVETEETEWMEYYAESISGILSEHPEVFDHDRLAAISSTIGSDYIMVFDEHGDEILCSGDYIHYSLGTAESEPLYEFRRIINGQECIAREIGKDPLSGRNTQLIGYRVKLPEDRGYGVLLISVDESMIDTIDRFGRMVRILHASVTGDSILFSLNDDKTIVEDSSVVSMTGMDVAGTGMAEKDLKETALSSFEFLGKHYYGASAMIGNRLHFYAFDAGITHDSALSFALYSSFLCLFCFLILAAVLLTGYNGKTFEASADENDGSGKEELLTPEGRFLRVGSLYRKWGLNISDWKQMIPEEKTKLAAELIFALYLSALMISIAFGAGRKGSIVTYLLREEWERGFNLFAVCTNLLIIASVMLGLLFARLLIRLASAWLSTKAETVFRLIFSLLQYVSLFTVLFYSFRNFGIDTSALLTAMGLISLAISMGARDLAADIIAGISNVFEGNYAVGDIVEIDGYRGKVMEIGVRSTKIMGNGDNVKIINNRNIRSILNTTQYNSWYVLNLKIASSFDLKTLEDILDRELPEMKKRMKKIVSGPIYRGVESIGKDSFTITILAECREEDYRWIQRQLNREIRLLFDREGIPIL